MIVGRKARAALQKGSGSTNIERKGDGMLESAWRVGARIALNEIVH